MEIILPIIAVTISVFTFFFFGMTCGVLLYKCAYIEMKEEIYQLKRIIKSHVYHCPFCQLLNDKSSCVCKCHSLEE